MKNVTTGLDDICQAFHDLLKGTFSDLLFGGHRTQSPLIIRLDGIECRYVRVRLPREDYLHLETIKVFNRTSEQLVNVAPQALVKASSIYPGSEALIQTRELVNPENVNTGIHTNKGEAEWVSLDLVDVSCIEECHIYNRDDMWASRAWGIVIEVSLDGTTWQQIYDHAARQNSLISCLLATRSNPSHTIEDRKLTHEFVEIVRMFFGGEQDACIARLGQLQLRDFLSAEKIRNEITRTVLADRQLDWNSHGVVHPFRYWEASEKTKSLSHVSELVSDLQKLSPHVCLGFGFVLAHVRDGDLIPHDDDVDVLIAFDRSICPSIKAGLKMLENHLTAYGYACTGDHFSHRWVGKENQYDWSHPSIDVFVGLVEGDFVSWYPSTRKNLAFKDVFPPKLVRQSGVECLIPNDPLRYLEQTYGEHWRIPDPRFGHPWDETAYADIA